MLVITLAIAIHMTIIKEGERVGVAINHRHCIFSAKGEAAVATQIVFLVAPDAVHAAHVELTGANHVVATAPLCIRTQIPHLACLVQLLVHGIELIEAKVLGPYIEKLRCAFAVPAYIAVLLVEHVASTIVSHGKAQGEVLHGIIHHIASKAIQPIGFRFLAIVIQAQLGASGFVYQQGLYKANGIGASMALDFVLIIPLDYFSGVGAVH